jgi:radical SAM superfamily enzyme YgiQ (UPF0313 family)
MGRRTGEPYIRTWQMEPLAPAVLAALTPDSVQIRFYDDRMEAIPYEEPTDLVAITMETYTARRSYQIATEYRKRGVPVVMGGFHATLMPDEAAKYADAVVIGEAEGLWPRVIDDFRNRSLRRIYRSDTQPSLAGCAPDRSIFAGKNYLPVALVETGRGCPYPCEFCAIQTFFRRTHRHRPVHEVVEELGRIKKPLVFFVDDNIIADPERARDLLRALIPLKIRWVGQAGIGAAFDDELLGLLRQSGCQGLLIGLESLDRDTLEAMGKSFVTPLGTYAAALANLRRHGIRLYVTFVFGYGNDTVGTVDRAAAFAERHRFFLTAFNHLTPFPGTPLYRRLEKEERLLFDRWWLDPGYRYGMLPFAPEGISPGELEERCIGARRRFFGWRSILRRGLDFRVNSRTLFMGFHFFLINLLMRREVLQRKQYPLGDEGFSGPLLEVDEGGDSAKKTQPFITRDEQDGKLFSAKRNQSVCTLPQPLPPSSFLPP